MPAQFQLVVQASGGDESLFDLVKPETRIGRDPINEVTLPSPFVSRLHATVVRKDGRVSLRAEGLNPTLVNDRELRPGESVDVRPGDSVVIQGFFLKIQATDVGPVVTEGDARAQLTALMTRLHEKVINRLDPRVFRLDSIKSAEGRQAAVKVLREELEHLDFESRAEMVAYAARESLRTTLLLSLLGGAGASDEETFGRADQYAIREQARLACVARLGAALGLKFDGSDGKDGLVRLREGFDEAYAVAAPQVTPELARHLTLWLLRKEVSDLVFGLGPLTDLVRMPDVSEIMVVSKDQIYIEQGGTLEETGRTFVSDRVSEQILERILGPINRRVDRSSPMVDARLPDGSRVNAIIPPLALKGPCLTIRRFSQDPLTIDDLIGFGALTAQVATFLRACVKGRKNIVISGGTGSGKTTLLNALSGWIPSAERIVTIEDTAELRLQQRHVVTLEARPPNAEQKGEVTIRDLVRNALRMRPDRIIVGECRGKEALDMLQAMNTGHEGSMTTGHANAPGDMLQRLEVMVLEAADLPLGAVRRQIVSGVDLIIQQSRLRDGRRRVVNVTEIVGLDDVTGDMIAEDVFTFREEGGMAFTGYLPTFADALIGAGHLNPAEVFWQA
jgi:Flp pilus assembly CpaF family ATPase